MTCGMEAASCIFRA